MIFLIESVSAAGMFKQGSDGHFPEEFGLSRVKLLFLVALSTDALADQLHNRGLGIVHNLLQVRFLQMDRYAGEVVAGLIGIAEYKVAIHDKCWQGVRFQKALEELFVALVCLLCQIDHYSSPSVC